MRRTLLYCALLFTLAMALPAFAAPVVVTIDAAKETGRFAPELLGNNVEWVGRCDGLLRPDGSFVKPALKTVKELAPPLLRFPGGTLAGTYVWTDGIGDPAKRGMSVNYDKQMEPMRFGTDEYLDLLARVGAQGLITLNDTAQAADNQAWVDYLLKKKGRITALEFGNESYLNQDPSFMPASTYVSRYKATMGPIREKHPGLKLGAILEAGMVRSSWVGHLVPETATWNETVVQGTGDLADFYAVHLYAPMEFVEDETTTLTTAIAAVAVFERNLADVRALLRRHHSNAAIWVTEYNVLTDKPVMNWRCGTAPAQIVFMADLLMAMARARVAGAASWSLLGNDNFGMIKSAAEPELRGSGRLFTLLAPLAGARALATDVKGPSLVYKPGGVVPEDFAAPIPLIGAQAFERDGRHILVLTNRDLKGSRRVVVQHADGTPWPHTSGTALLGPMDFVDGVDQGGRMQAVSRAAGSGLVLLPGSVTMLELAAPGSQGDGK